MQGNGSVSSPSKEQTHLCTSQLKNGPCSDDSMIGRPDTYKLWRNESMVRAMEAVAQGQSVRRAAEEHGIPRSTLHDRIAGKVEHGSRSGPRKYLTHTRGRRTCILSC